MNGHRIVITGASSNGFTVIEVVVALFIFGLVSSSIYKLMGHANQLRSRALYVEDATRIAADESERIKYIAAKNEIFEDSTYVIVRHGRPFKVERHTITSPSEDQIVSSNPLHISIRISNDKQVNANPLEFELLIGSDSP